MIKIPCTIEEATEYVEKNCGPYEQVDEIGTFGTNEVNKVWWTDTRHAFSNQGMRKVAHSNSLKGMLYVY